MIILLYNIYRHIRTNDECFTKTSLPVTCLPGLEGDPVQKLPEDSGQIVPQYQYLLFPNMAQK